MFSAFLNLFKGGPSDPPVYADSQDDELRSREQAIKRIKEEALAEINASYETQGRGKRKSSYSQKHRDKFANKEVQVTEDELSSSSQSDSAEGEQSEEAKRKDKHHRKKHDTLRPKHETKKVDSVRKRSSSVSSSSSTALSSADLSSISTAGSVSSSSSSSSGSLVTEVDNSAALDWLQERMKTEITVFHTPEVRKKLLVLDIDYTLFDHKSDFDLAPEYMRPYLYEFLTTLSEHYDIVIWSATALVHILTKIEKLGLLSHPDFKISFVLSKEHMVPFKILGRRKVHEHDIKPLRLIWNRFPGVYTPHNTVHIDDLFENFAMNLKNGIQIRPYKEGLKSRLVDKELFFLTQYLLIIARLDTFENLDHLKWKDYTLMHIIETQTSVKMPPFVTPAVPSEELLALHEKNKLRLNQKLLDTDTNSSTEVLGKNDEEKEIKGESEQITDIEDLLKQIESHDLEEKQLLVDVQKLLSL